LEIADLLFVDPEIGYLGLAAANFFGSLIPFIPFPAFLVLATMSLNDQFDIHVMAIISAFTATVAKQIIFSVSYSGRKALKKDTKKRIKPFEVMIKRYGGVAAFVAAATPIPDDLVYIPLGLAKYNPLKFFIATITGKFVISYGTIFAAQTFGPKILDHISENVTDVNMIYSGAILFVIMTTVIIILVLRLDWEKILSRIAPWTLVETEDSTDNDKNGNIN